MSVKRLLRHLLFWIVFFGAGLFNDLYLSDTFSSNPNWHAFFQVVLSQLLVFLIKIGVVYYAIYSIIPRWTERQAQSQTHGIPNMFREHRKSSTIFLVEFVALLFLGAFCIRLMIQQVVWVYIYDLEPRTLSVSSLIARFIYSLFDIIPITLVAVAIKLVQLRIKALKHETMLVAEKVKSELLYLKSQTNPHFLFNTLNSIYALSRKQDEHTPKAIISLSKILRYMLYETSHHTNPLKDELVLIEDYISLQKLRFQEHLTIRFAKNLDQEATRISPLLLLPLVENAFKHSNALNMEVDIQVDLKGSLLDFVISNNLSESVEPNEAFEDGMGLNNIKRQLAILYREYSFTAEKGETDFKVHLHIDLNTYAHV